MSTRCVTWSRLVAGAIVAALLVMGCVGRGPAPTPIPEDVPAFALTSSAFPDGEAIPERYTCDGEDVSPPLSWAQPPAGTETLALVVDDPDAPGGTWVHWVLFNIPGDVRDLAVGAEAPEFSVAGNNSWGRTGYGGPCPPSGTHRYVMTLYALDVELSLEVGATKRDVLQAAEGHVMGLAQLVGTYSR